MRIAYLSSDYGVPVLGGKGASVHVQQIIAGFAADGHDVTLYCARRGDGDPGKVGARIVEIGRPSPVTHGADAARSERILKERGWMARAAMLEKGFLADHAEIPFDIIYERYSLWSRAGVAAGRKVGIPVMVEVNAPLVTEAEQFRELASKSEARAIEEEVLRSADAIIAVSDGIRDYVIEQGTRPSRVHVIPNGVDCQQFSPIVEAARLPELGNAPVIGFVGGLKPWHGLQELLAAFEIVARRSPEAKLLIVGDGPMRGWIEGFLTGTRLSDRVVITGWLEHDKLPSLVARMDIATAPYPRLPDFYFSPLKLFEYMASGKAVVASRIGQIASVVRDGVDGMLVGPGDVIDLADKLCQLVDNIALRKKLGGHATRAAQEFSWRSNACRTARIGTALCTDFRKMSEGA